MSELEALKKKYFLAWLALALLLLVFDQVSKRGILTHYAYGAVREVTSFFNIVHVHNTGAAFSFLSSAGGWQIVFFSVIALAVSAFILFLLWRQSLNRLLSLGLSLILSGAIGNLIDRICYGFVVDFLDVHALGYHWPAFNLADTWICVGAGLMVFDALCASGSR